MGPLAVDGVGRRTRTFDFGALHVVGAGFITDMSAVHITLRGHTGAEAEISSRDHPRETICAIA